MWTVFAYATYVVTGIETCASSLGGVTVMRKLNFAESSSSAFTTFFSIVRLEGSHSTWMDLYVVMPLMS